MRVEVAVPTSPRHDGARLARLGHGGVGRRQNALRGRVRTGLARLDRAFARSSIVLGGVITVIAIIIIIIVLLVISPGIGIHGIR